MANRARMAMFALRDETNQKDRLLCAFTMTVTVTLI